MSVEVRPAETGDIDGVCDLLHEHMSAKISKAKWRNLLDYPWRPEDASRGCVAVDSGRIVGFLGLVFADRPIDGRMHRFCNICAWYLRKEYRGRGIGQAMQTMSVADASQVYTILTATEATGRAFSGSGFRVLDRERYILRRTGGPHRNLDCLEDLSDIEASLDPTERRILQDHRVYNLRHLLFRRGEETCYVIFQAKRKGEDIDYREVLHVSDTGFLRRHAQGIANMVLKADGAVFAFDKRFISEEAPFETEAMRLPRWFRSSSVAPRTIDHLYSEIVLLDLKL